jgi:hypothetical protein
MSDRAKRAQSRAAEMPFLQSPDSQNRSIGGGGGRAMDWLGFRETGVGNPCGCHWSMTRIHEHVSEHSGRQFERWLRSSRVGKRLKVGTAGLGQLGFRGAIRAALRFSRSQIQREIQKANPGRGRRRGDRDHHTEDQQGCQNFPHGRRYSPIKADVKISSSNGLMTAWGDLAAGGRLARSLRLRAPRTVGRPGL